MNLLVDIHVDKHYGTGTNVGQMCHGDSGDAGYFGAPGTDCDSPQSLLNATFSWIRDNIIDDIDFIVWTGDAARHDNDEQIPRTQEEVAAASQLIVQCMYDILVPKSGLEATTTTKRQLPIPFVPTIGNNDVMPHNIFSKAPNHWTKRLGKIWWNFIPEAQRHTFARGGWFYVEVIPDRLAVFSLNTLYFFDSNGAVDGCYEQSQPGYEHMEWLTASLEIMRRKGAKVLFIGHIPPARSGKKNSWDETCWQKYTLLLRQFRDVVIGSLYGHMNIDHFMFQDAAELEISEKAGDFDRWSPNPSQQRNNDFSVSSRATYLWSLRSIFSGLPRPPFNARTSNDNARDSSPINRPDRSINGYFKEIGGPWAERYSLTLVSGSFVPNYFPSVRVVEYNVSGLEDLAVWSPLVDKDSVTSQAEDDDERNDSLSEDSLASNKKKNKKKKGKGPKIPPFKKPTPPSSDTPPGPAYSNQPLSLLSYTQYFSNLTKINVNPAAGLFYETLYDTKTDKIYGLKDLTINSYLQLARQIGDGYTESSCKGMGSGLGCQVGWDVAENSSEVGSPMERKWKGKKGKGKGKKGGKRKGKGKKNKVWVAFFERAFIGNVPDDLEGDE